jgi:hypothetical protein
MNAKPGPKLGLFWLFWKFFSGFGEIHAFPALRIAVCVRPSI